MLSDEGNPHKVIRNAALSINMPRESVVLLEKRQKIDYPTLKIQNTLTSPSAEDLPLLENSRFIQLLTENKRRSSLRIHQLKPLRLETTPNTNTLSKLLEADKLSNIIPDFIENIQNTNSSVKKGKSSESIIRSDSFQNKPSANFSSGNLVKMSSSVNNFHKEKKVFTGAWRKSYNDSSLIAPENMPNINYTEASKKPEGYNNASLNKKNSFANEIFGNRKATAQIRSKILSIKNVFTDQVNENHKKINFKKFENITSTLNFYPPPKNPLNEKTSKVKLFQKKSRKNISIESVVNDDPFFKTSHKVPRYSLNQSNFCDFYSSTMYTSDQNHEFNINTYANKIKIYDLDHLPKFTHEQDDSSVLSKPKPKLQTTNMHQKNSLSSLHSIDYNRWQVKKQSKNQPRKNQSSLMEFSSPKKSLHLSKFKNGLENSVSVKSKHSKYKFDAVLTDFKQNELKVIDSLKKNVWLELIQKVIALPEIKNTSRIRYYEVLGIKKADPLATGSDDYNCVRDLFYKIKKDIEAERKYEYNFRPLALEEIKDISIP
jgi:hypothetical protein